MSVKERGSLSLGLVHGHSLRTMAIVLGRMSSTVSREFACKAMRGPFRASPAQTRVEARVRQPRQPRTLLDPCRWRYVWTGLARGFLPEQLAGRIRHEYPSDMRKHLLAETVCVALSVWR